MIKTKSISLISERECYHHQSSTIHATTVMCISCSSMSVWYWHSTFITEHRSAHMTSSDALNSTSSISLPLLLSYPVFFPLYSCLGCQQRMSWPHVAQATMQGWPPFNILSPPRMVTKPWVVVIGFSSILHLKYHGQRLHPLLYACMELDFNSKFSFLFQ